MNDFLKIGLIGAAAWFVWQAIANSQATATTSSTPSAPATPALNTTLVAQLNAAMPGYWSPLQGQSATFNGSATPSQWNYVWNAIAPGTQAAQLTQFGVSQNITAAQYVAALQAAGLAGYRRWRAA